MIAPDRAMPTFAPGMPYFDPYTLANVGAPSTMTSAVSLRGLRKSFGNLETIAGIDLEVEARLVRQRHRAVGMRKVDPVACRCRSGAGNVR